MKWWDTQAFDQYCNSAKCKRRQLFSLHHHSIETDHMTVKYNLTEHAADDCYRQVSNYSRWWCVGLQWIRGAVAHIHHLSCKSNSVLCLDKLIDNCWLLCWCLLGSKGMRLKFPRRCVYRQQIIRFQVISIRPQMVLVHFWRNLRLLRASLLPNARCDVSHAEICRHAWFLCWICQFAIIIKVKMCQRAR